MSPSPTQRRDRHNRSGSKQKPDLQDRERLLQEQLQLAVSRLLDDLIQSGFAPSLAKPLVSAKQSALAAPACLDQKPVVQPLIVNEWPRGLVPRLAAKYVGLSLNALNEGVKDGTFQKPCCRGRKKTFDRLRLDQDLDRLFGRGQKEEFDLNWEFGGRK